MNRYTPTVQAILGEAGTGKTTLLLKMVKEWIDNGWLQDGVSILRGKAAAPFVFCSYTNSAVQRIRAKAPEGWPCMTIHKLLEFRPESIADENLMFQASKGKINKIEGLQLIVIDEITQISIGLYEKLRDALPKGCHVVLAGDPNQLPALFGTSLMQHVLSWEYYKGLDVIRLTKQWRQTKGLLKLAHSIINGEAVQADRDNGVRILVGDGIANTEYGFGQITDLLKREGFQPGKDILICPMRTHTKLQSCYHYSKWIAERALPDASKLVEILPLDGLFIQVGDILQYQKEEWVLLEIEPNPNYTGNKPATSVSNRYGHHRKVEGDEYIWADFSIQDSKTPFYGAELSHKLILKSLIGGEEVEVSWLYKNNIEDQLDLSGATTVHRAQGNEWDRVFFLTLGIHNHMCTKELLYTGVTRAKAELVWITSKGPKLYGIRKSKGYTVLPKAKLLRLET